MATPESRVKRRVSQILKAHGVHFIMPVQHGMGTPALDYHCCHCGRYLALETKAPGKKMTPRQELTAEAIREAGGIVLLVDGTDGYRELLDTLASLGGSSEVQNCIHPSSGFTV